MKLRIALTISLLFIINNCFAVSLDDMIGQKILVGFGQKHQYHKVLTQARRGEITGVIFFERDIKDSKSLLKMTEKFNKANKKLPLLVSIDQEGGYVQRMKKENGFTDYKSAKKIAQGNTKSAFGEYFLMSNELKYYGFNLNFTPCLDLAVNKDSIIEQKERAYSDDSDIVIKYAKEAIKAHYMNKIATSIKHFPGHGSATGDTHKGFVDVTEAYDEKELETFKALSHENPLQTLMVAHTFNKNYDDDYPASLSYTTVGLARQFFHGVIITDDLDMGAIKDNYELEDIVVTAINADVDILLFSNYNENNVISPKKIREIIKKAIAEGKIDKAQIEKSYKRIVSFKKAFN